jgi:hypothetical protein
MIPDERGKSRTSAGSEMLNAAREVAYQRERRLGVMCVMVARNPTPHGLCRGWLNGSNLELGRAEACEGGRSSEGRICELEMCLFR